MFTIKLIAGLLFLCSAVQAELFFTPEMISSHLKTYSIEELREIEKDLVVVRSVCMDGKGESAAPFYLATAGAPGSRKSTILEKFLAAHSEYQEGVYLDPDPRALRYMVHTYYARSLSPLAISRGEDYGQVIRQGYEKWRGASNYISLTLLEEAFAKRCSIVYGTTSTGGHTSQFLSKLKKNGYRVELLLCSCPDSVRKEAVEYRNEEIRFYQSSPEDAVNKGLLFPQRMQDYFNHADTLYFYWSDAIAKPERLAGVWHSGKLEIVDAEALDRFIGKYEADREILRMKGEIIPPFDSYSTSRTFTSK